MDHAFTERIKTWLETPEDQRDYMDGALMVLKLSGNSVLYRNLTANIERHKDSVEFHLQKYYNFRVQALTHAQVEEMQAKVDSIVAERLSLAAEADSAPTKGRRPDHDKLPPSIIAAYEENFTLIHRMRELHMKLRSLSLENATCPDSERYPYLKELIECDTKLRKNWEVYDNYIVTGSTKVVATPPPAPPPSRKATKKTPKN